MSDPRLAAIPDIHGHAKGEHKPYGEERPIPYSARMLFLWFYHATLRGRPRFMMVADHINFLTFEDPAAVNLVRRALKLAAAGDLYGAAETAGVDLSHAAVVCDGLRRGMRYSIGAEVDNDPRARPDAQNIVDAMKPDGLIRSVHFLPIEHPVHGAGWQWPFDNAEFAPLYDTIGVDRVWEIYITTLIEAVEKLPGHIVGHFYVPAKFGHWPEEAKLEEYEDRLIAACRERGTAVEINTRFVSRYLEDEAQQQRYLEANLRLLRKAKAGGVGVAIGSDAHSPKDQGAGFERVLELLDAAEVNELVFPIGGRLARVALRATKEHMEQHAAAAAPQAAASEPGSASGEGSDEDEPAESVAAAEAPAVKKAARRARPPRRPPKPSVPDASDVAPGPLPAESPASPAPPAETPVAAAPPPETAAAVAPPAETPAAAEPPTEIPAAATETPAAAAPPADAPAPAEPAPEIPTTATPLADTPRAAAKKRPPPKAERTTAKPARPAISPKPAAPKPAAGQPKPVKPAKPANPAKPAKAALARPAAKRTAQARPAKKTAKPLPAAKRAQPSRATAKPAAKPAAKPVAKAASKPHKRAVAKPATRKTVAKKAQPKKKPTKSRR